MTGAEISSGRRLSSSRVRHGTVGILVLAFAINALDGYDVMTLAYAAPALAKDLLLRPAQLAAVFGASAAGTALGAALLGRIADQIGRRWVVLGAIVLMCISTIASALIATSAQLISVRAVNGVAVGGILASLTALVADHVSSKDQSAAVGLIHSGYLGGAVGGGLLSAWLLPLIGWRNVFLAGAAIMGVVFVVAALLLPESPAFMRGEGGQRPASGQRQDALEGLGALLNRSGRARTLWLWMAFFLVFFTMYFVQSWTPKIAADVGASLRQAVLAGTMINVGGALGSVSVGLAARRFGLSRTLAITLVSAAVSLGLAGLLAAPAPVLLALCFMTGWTVLGGFVGLYMLAARLYGPTVRATAVGWAAGVARLGAVVSPFAAGWLLGHNLSTPVVCGLFALPLLVAAGVAGSVKQLRTSN